MVLKRKRRIFASFVRRSRLRRQVCHRFVLLLSCFPFGFCPALFARDILAPPSRRRISPTRIDSTFPLCSSSSSPFLASFLAATPSRGRHHRRRRRLFGGVGVGASKTERSGRVVQFRRVRVSPTPSSRIRLRSRRSGKLLLGVVDFEVPPSLLLLLLLLHQC